MGLVDVEDREHLKIQPGQRLVDPHSVDHAGQIPNPHEVGHYPLELGPGRSDGRATEGLDGRPDAVRYRSDVRPGDAGVGVGLCVGVGDRTGVLEKDAPAVLTGDDVGEDLPAAGHYATIEPIPLPWYGRINWSTPIGNSSTLR